MTGLPDRDPAQPNPSERPPTPAPSEASGNTPAEDQQSRPGGAAPGPSREPGDGLTEPAPETPGAPDPAFAEDRSGGRPDEPDRPCPAPSTTWVPPSRLSPKVLLINPVRTLPSLLLPLAGVLFVGGFSAQSFAWAAVGVIGSVLFSVIRWATFRYGVVDDRLELTQSLISRSVRTIPLERIRGVDVSTPLLHRLLGLAVLRIDTGAHGGGDKQEGELDGVTAQEAERLRTLLLRTAAARRADRPVPAENVSAAPAPDTPAPAAPPRRDTAPAAEEPEPQTVYLRVPRRWLAYGLLSGAYLYTPFVVLAGAATLVLQWGEQFGLEGRVLWEGLRWLWDRPYLLVIAAVVLVAAMPFTGMATYAVLHWDFTLRAREGYLVAERGLLTQRAVSLERRRVRGYEIVDTPTERWAKIARVWAIVTGLGDSQTRGQLLPAVPRKDALETVGRAVGTLAAPLRPHPPQARRRRLFRAVAPWAALAAAGTVPPLFTGVWTWWVISAVALALALLGIPLGLDRYRSLGHAYDGTRLSVRSGSLRRVQAVVERRAVVGWTFRQTWFQRRARVMTVIAGVGAGAGGYEAVDVAEEAGPAFAAEVTPDWVTPFIRSS
ncbi:PH domain-containing protein [Thermostaphylospora chromogena]|uniref:Putative membrane protein n=1 Tax=Thermostaphylospora chromogena TaxID=35622 RepID=A0A1H1HYM7_9ACTN|nr:PH domain-containing protein [Thermostaphylospora chromogena]SDR30565.1 putative membrane protein [Thermostaphylospora chromogena]